MDDLLHLARLALAFGKVDRVTFHPDGVTRESDTGITAAGRAEKANREAVALAELLLRASGMIGLAKAG